MRTKIRIEKIRINDSKEIIFKENSINVFVGANNVGKSALLKEIYLKSEYSSYPSNIATRISFKTNGTSEDFLADIKDHSREELYAGGEKHYQGLFFDIYDSSSAVFDSLLELRQVRNFIMLALNTEDRIRSSDPPPGIDNLQVPPSHLIHLLPKNDLKYSQFKEEFRKAFNTDIMLNHGAGNVLPLHIGEEITINKESGEDRVSSTYVERLNKLPRINEQGDGIRSFTGILLALLSAPQQILLIDEPEAFLHPPQARLLGEIIGRNEQGRQIFIATHSIDFILGLLSNKGETSIIRMGREGDLNPTVDIDEAKIKTIWSDPLLRYSKILDGLFYNQVVICESESDSMFYQTMISEEDSSHSVFFTNANGKGQMAKIINAFKLTNIKTDVIVDIDILADDGTLKRIYESLGGNWSEINSEYNKIREFLDTELATPSRKQICDLLSPIFVSEEGRINEVDRKILNQAVDNTKKTKDLKTTGFKFFEAKEDINITFGDLNKKLEEKGVHIVPVGELEGFDPRISNHGPEWTIKAINKFSNGESYQEAKDFILSIINP